jgi:hypothetical protein
VLNEQSKALAAQLEHLRRATQIVAQTWAKLKPLTLEQRQVTGVKTMWESFEMPAQRAALNLAAKILASHRAQQTRAHRFPKDGSMRIIAWNVAHREVPRRPAVPTDR